MNSILIVGGGTAGWLTAAILAAKHVDHGVSIMLIEAPDIPIVGVGEGTWPSMRSTLHSIGVNEEEFIRYCNVSYKQASKFVGWKNGQENDYYYHPFDLPQGFYDVNLAQYWVDSGSHCSFSEAVSVQQALCEQHLSPKLKSSSHYAGIANYGYHLDAGRFSEFLKQHCIQQLGVNFIADKVVDVIPQSNGDIASVMTQCHGSISADLFIDCTGFHSLLIEQHYGFKLIDKSAVLPINAALAVQIPYEKDSPIHSATISTAQEAGWVWDIGLSTRRGVGHVYSDAHATEQQAASALQRYLNFTDKQFEQLEPRKIGIKPGYREKFWHKNCVAVGLSAGFLEPLEASAMVLIETTANMIADQLPKTRGAMTLIAKRFNRRCEFRWERIIDFLKLHYILSERKEPFWRDVADRSSISSRLRDDLELWQHQAPWKTEFDSLDEAFPAASYQYVLYGMGFNTQSNNTHLSQMAHKAPQLAMHNVSRSRELLLEKAESNRSILNLIRSV